MVAGSRGTRRCARGAAFADVPKDAPWLQSKRLLTRPCSCPPKNLRCAVRTTANTRNIRGPSPVATSIEGVRRTMNTTNVRLLTTLVLPFALIGGATGLLVYDGLASPPAPRRVRP